MLQIAGAGDDLIVVVREPDVSGLVQQDVDDGLLFVDDRSAVGLDLGERQLQEREDGARPLEDRR
ncbi:hypothetical protein ACFRFU_48840 [Streptomyces sp. NPDC056704]|uniref:hypothetical protein n=1 Tax=Streptomyces sp. NPDC056704 TaxID=3345917 RepID=UPI00368CC993